MSASALSGSFVMNVHVQTSEQSSIVNEFVAAFNSIRLSVEIRRNVTINRFLSDFNCGGFFRVVYITIMINCGTYL